MVIIQMNPSEILERFSALFADSFISVPESDKGRNRFVLTETDQQAKLQAIEIRGVPKNSILLKTYDYSLPVKVFKSTKGERKMCDYILLTPYKGDLYLIFIEMKSQNLDNRDLISQLVGGNCFMTYCAAMAEKFHDARISLKQKRNIVLHAPLPLNKKPTRLDKRLKKSFRTALQLSDPIVLISCAAKKGRAFTFFERLVFDMPEEVRDV